MKSISILGSQWQPSNEFVLEHLSSPRSCLLKLDGFQKGLDNAHIDVLLDPALTKAIDTLVASCLRQHLQELSLTEQSQMTSKVDEVAIFSRIHQAVSLAVNQAARSSSRRELVQLYQLSLVKTILMRTDKELKLLQEDLESGLDEPQGFSGRTSLRRREQFSALSLQQQTIRYRVCGQMLRILRKIESGGLRKARKSLIGLSWPVSKSMLFNPLIQLGGVDGKEDFLTNYPYLFYQSGQFGLLNKIVTHELSSWLPSYLEFLPILLYEDDYKSLPSRRDTGELPGYAEVEEYLRRVISPLEYKENKRSWLDDPSNLVKLLGGEKGEWPQPGPWRNSGWAGFQRDLLAKLEKALAQRGVLTELYASVQMPQLARDLGRHCPLRAVFEYLAEKRLRKSLLQQLHNAKGGADIHTMLVRVEQAKKDIKQMSEGHRQQALVSMLAGYVRLRKDLKTSWTVYLAMNHIKLLDSEEDTNLSRSNGLLNEFMAASEGLGESAPQVTGHVIIKADLRGSTLLTARMRDKNLNPAAYFSQNLFDPINILLEKYGAIKVFIEGDALILMILEYAGHQQNGMVVARACGLSNKMLEVVRHRNGKNRHLGLPELELGIGIAYVDESPTYLFDDGHRITISSAINRADRLSSNASALRGIGAYKGKTGWGVEVVLPDHRGVGLSGKQALQRYNVNGIQLDTPAFSHLLNELVLKKIKATGIGGNANDKHYVGRFPDLTGKNVWLMVREAKVRIWDGDSFGQSLKPVQKFYEVVSNSKMLKRLRDKLSDAS